MRKLLCAMLVLALLAVPVLALSVSAESVVDEDIILSDLIPSAVDSNFDAVDCEAVINRDGSMTVTITGAAPILKIKLAEGTLVYTGADVNVKEPAYVAVDFGTAGSIQFTHMIIHYTRKDKDAAGTFADLYLNSMCDANYAQYRKQISDPGYTAGTALANGGNYYTVWDWGTYVNADGKVFDNGMHKFVDMEINLTGSTVGSQVTFYTIAVVDDPEVELGTVTPDPIVPGDDDPSEDPSEDPSDEDPSDEPSTDESTDEPEESSAVEESSEESKTEESSTATSAETSSTENTSGATSSTETTSDAEEEGGSSTGLIIGIIAAVVVVIGAVVAVVVVKKKKK